MLKGEKVTLRALERSDIPNCHRWINDWEVTRFLKNIYPWSLAEEEKWYEEQPQRRGRIWAIVAEDGKHIGNVTLDYIAFEDGTANLGIMIGEKEYWGRGYGTDAIRTILLFAFNSMNLNRVQLGVYEFNPRAQRCYQKCGFVVEGRHRQRIFREGRYWDEVRMGILREEFMGRRD